MRREDQSGPRVSRKAVVAVVAVALAGFAAVLGALLWDQRVAGEQPLVTVYKHPDCNCCNKG